MLGVPLLHPSRCWSATPFPRSQAVLPSPGSSACPGSSSPIQVWLSELRWLFVPGSSFLSSWVGRWGGFGGSWVTVQRHFGNRWYVAEITKLGDCCVTNMWCPSWPLFSIPSCHQLTFTFFAGLRCTGQSDMLPSVSEDVHRCNCPEHPFPLTNESQVVIQEKGLLAEWTG